MDWEQIIHIIIIWSGAETFCVYGAGRWLTLLCNLIYWFVSYMCRNNAGWNIMYNNSGVLMLFIKYENY